MNDTTQLVVFVQGVTNNFEQDYSMASTTLGENICEKVELIKKFEIDSSKLVGITTVSILLVRKANAKGSVSGFEIAPPSKGGGSDKHLAVN